METARENKGYVKVFKVKSFSGLELTKIENAKETMIWKFLGKDGSEKLLDQIVLLLGSNMVAI